MIRSKPEQTRVSGEVMEGILYTIKYASLCRSELLHKRIEMLGEGDS